MGKLVAVFKIMPESPDVDLEAIKDAVRKLTPKEAELQGFQIEPIAFGLKAVNVTIVMDDEEGVGPDGVEEVYNGIPNVASVQITDVGRI